MRKKKLCNFLLQAVCLSYFILLLLGGCGGDKGMSEEELAAIPFAQREGLPEPTGGFVLAVCGEAITSDEIIGPTAEHFRPIARGSDFEQFKERARPQLEQLVVSKISNILLYDKARKRLGANVDEVLEKAVDAEVRRFIGNFNGDYAKAEEVLRKDGLDWEGFKEYQKRMILSQHYLASQVPDTRPATYSELIDYYNNVKGDTFTKAASIQFQLIDIQPAKAEPADPNKSKEEYARGLAAEIMKRLDAGEDFGELAKKYSHGHRAAGGGMWRPVKPDSFAAPYDVLAREAEKMVPGGISGPLEAGEHIFVMKLHEKQAQSVEPFEKVQKEIEAKINFDRRKEAIDKFGEELVRQAAVGNKDAFVDYCAERIWRMANQ